VRDLYRTLRSPRKTVLEALKALEDDGRVLRVQNAYSGRGRPPEKYELIESDSVMAAT
jgi:predicted ArsR family transcriptional regulator